jgi:hypothetical protein
MSYDRAGFLPHPPGPDLFDACPSCGRRKFLEFKRAEPHPLLGQLNTYACKYCGREMSFGREFPPYAV